MAMINRYEYADDTLDNVRILTRALFDICLSRKYIQEEKIVDMFTNENQRTTLSLGKDAPVLSVLCPTCNHTTIARMDRVMKCVYCGSVLDPNKLRADNDTFIGVGLDRLFQNEVTRDDIRIEFTSQAGSDQKESDARSKKDRMANLVLSSIDPIMGISLSYANAHYNNQTTGAFKDDPVEDFIVAKNRISIRICSALKIIFINLSLDKPGNEEVLFDRVSAIGSRKQHSSPDVSGAFVPCPSCGEKNLRKNLFSVSCTSCGTEIPLAISPDFNVYYVNDAHEKEAGFPLVRKNEYLYTLFEAVFSFVQEYFPVSYKDLTEVVHVRKEYRKDKTDTPTRICEFCHRPMLSLSPIGSKCVYCGKSSGVNTIDRFL